MNPAHYQKLWAAVGAALLLYSVNTWLSSQGANAFLDIKLLDQRPVAGALIAIPICAVLLILLAGIGIAYARSSGAKSWHARVPVVWLENIDTATSHGCRYQAFFLFLFIALPAASLIHFLREIMTADVIEKMCRAKILTLWYIPSWETLTSTSYWDDGFRIGDTIEPNSSDLDGTVTWFPLIEPAILICLVLTALWRALAFTRVVFFEKA